MTITLAKYKEWCEDFGVEKANEMAKDFKITDADGTEVVIVTQPSAPAEPEAEEEAVNTAESEAKMIKAVKDAVQSEIKASRPHIEVKAPKLTLAHIVKGVIDGTYKQTNINSEATNAAGGILLPIDVSDQVCAALFASPLFSRVRRVPVTAQVLRILWRNYGAITARTITQSNQGGEKSDDDVEWAGQNITLENVYALTPVADELLEDIPQVAAQIQDDHTSEIQGYIERGILTGIGAFTGVVAAPGTLTLPRAAANRVSRVDLADMYARLWRSGGLNPAAVAWSINPQVFGELESFRDANAVEVAGAPAPTIYGYPIIMSPFNPVLGQTGDVVLADWSKYTVGVKSSGMNFDVSPHVWFNRDLTAFRSTMRLAGAQCQQALITEGGLDYSFFVELGPEDLTGSGSGS